MPSGKIEKIQFSVLVVAAGCHSGEIGDFLRMGSGPGYLSLPLPIAPRFLVFPPTINTTTYFK